MSNQQQWRHQQEDQLLCRASFDGANEEEDPNPPSSSASPSSKTAEEQFSQPMRWQQQRYFAHDVHRPQLQGPLPLPCIGALMGQPVEEQLPPLSAPPPPVPPVQRPGSALSFLSTDNIDAADQSQWPIPGTLQYQPIEEQLSTRRGRSLSFLSTDNRDAEDKKNSNPKHVKMKKWVDAALHSLDDTAEDDASNKKKKISSGAFLMCALKIAHSLADQLCKLEHECEDKEGRGAMHEHSPTSSEGFRWPDLITVYLNDSMEEGNTDRENCLPENVRGDDDCKNELSQDEIEGRFHPVDPNSRDAKKFETKPNEFEGRFYPADYAQSHEYGSEKDKAGEAHEEHDLVFDILPEIYMGVHADNEDRENPMNTSKPVFFGTEKFQGEGNSEVIPPVVDYLKVASARIQFEGQCVHTTSTQKCEKRMSIYYLGLVFLELFSGGKSPVAEDSGTHPHGDRPSDFTHAMGILGAIGDDDELFGGMDMGLNESEHSEVDGGRGIDGDNRNKKFRNFRHVGGEIASGKNIQASEASSITVEQLKLLGLPIALCDLIENMIDCAGGDLSGDETYSSMEDVTEDLRLMMESPGVYLRDLDLDLACKVGLQMDDMTATWYGRDKELASLKETYRSSIFDQCGAAIIYGQRGLGKSPLAWEFSEYAKVGDEKNNTKECIFLSGKFDKLRQSQPFPPIAEAFNKYCNWLSLSDESKSIAEEVSKALKLTLGQEAYALVKSIPNLSKIIGEEPDFEERDCFEDAHKRLCYQLSQFAKVISQSHRAPLVLFIDNLQWADSDSITLLKQILLVFGSTSHHKSNQFFFIGCCNEMEEGHDLWNMLHFVSNFGVKTTKIELNCLEKETVNLMISKKLNMLPRLTRPLTDILYHKTKGNPFFLRQLMLELSKEGLLCPSLSRCRWVWEEEKIQERELPDDAVSFLTASLGRLPSEVLSALFTLSCFGPCSDRALVGLEEELGLSLSGPLDHAVAEGFLNKKDGNYQFVDDRVKESAYNTMKPEEQYLHHFKYGWALCSVAERNGDDGVFLIAVGQINLGGPNAITDDNERLTVANHNLMAGKKTMAMSDFFSAYWFFDYGISYLKKGHWEAHYDLSLALYDGAAECALIIGEHSSLSILTEQIMHYTKSIEDKLNVFDVSMRVLLYRSNVSAAIECAIEVLSNLGVDFPEEVNPDIVISFIERTKEMLDGMSDEELINYKPMSNSNNLMAMEFLGRLSEALYMIRPNDQPVAVLKMVQLSLMHGMNPISPLAFVSYGSFLASMGDIREGYRYARIAKALLESVHSRRVAGAVVAYATQIMAYVEPVQSAIELHVDGREAALKSGKNVYAILNNFLYDSCSYWSGKKLSSVKSQLDVTVSLTKQRKNLPLLVQLMPLYGSVSTMIGLADSCLSDTEADVFESGFDVETLGRIVRRENPFQSKPYYFNKMYAAFLFRYYSGMKSAADSYSKFKVGSWVFVFSSSIQVFYEGLVSFWIGRKEEDNDWIEKGKNWRRAIESLAESSSKWNFENKALLLQAEEQYCDGNFEVAEKLYDGAILSAKKHHFLNEEALALELAGLFFLKTGRKIQCMTYLSQAVEKYREWEAYAKALSLENYLEEVEKYFFEADANRS